jgi:hypothetical protein
MTQNAEVRKAVEGLQAETVKDIDADALLQGL